MLVPTVSSKCIKIQQLDNLFVRNTPTRYQHLDSTNEISALVIGKSGEKLFGMPCKDLVLNQRLIGQKKIFHLRFRNRRNTFNSSDVLIYNVYDDAAMEPITPHMLPRETTISSTTVSSSTSPPETSGQSHKRKREFVRRALFIGNEQRFRFDFHAIIKSDGFVLLFCVKNLTSFIDLALFEIYL
ncbi:hypothetical protein DVH24_034375 [Malus domestica]|uniref:Uncharacterized protein n=1 Tax=Malus domestica TaxID=3750 RepID=A0A498IYT0_MALDO|nr:hypothetical protein DVH24_034375 [Malus domestica]